MAQVGAKVIRDHLIEQHRLFYPQLPFVVLGTVDEKGQPWATLRANKPGFLFAPDQHTLSVTLPQDDLDPADSGMENGEAIGLLGIELATKRRNRLNGTINRINQTSFNIKIGHSFGNCPKYIVPRNLAFNDDPDLRHDQTIETGTELSENSRALIARSDTFFIASYVDRDDSAQNNRHREVDVSHRGGESGFVHLEKDGSLTIPDYAGNRFFNTLGNLLINPRAGLVFVDFINGDILQITGTAEIIMGGSKIDQFKAAERLISITPTQWIYRRNAFPLRMVAPPA
ncbi:MAG: pyridoxamine 5'-phosphate oxidase family protein [Rhodospirillales bacterium]|nr:pyridoxamine 5'-phosphate oxidase family protein [Rhodospirillales bacterium]